MTAYEFFGWPAFWIVLASMALLLATEVLHVAGVRWRPGRPEVLAVVAAGVALAVSAARFFVYT